jgi:hypothetical protein
MILAMVLAVVTVPTLMQASEMDDARMAAERDGKSDVNGMLWLGAGCCCGWLAVGAAYLMEPSPPASRLLGKSPEYVTAYTDTYVATGKSAQTSNAWTGCVVNALANTVILIIYFAVLASAD